MSKTCNGYLGLVTADYPDFSGQTLISQGYIETGSTFSCDLSSTSIKDNESDVTFSLYPNPAQNNISISSKVRLQSITIYNITGILMMVKLTTKNNISINTTGLNNGIFLMKVLFSNGIVYFKKVIIEN